MPARAECLTLMPGQPANAGYGRAPGRHLGFTDVTLGGPFATPRARLTVSCLWTSCAHSNRSGWRMILSAVSGIETSSLRSSSGKDSSPASPSRHLRCQVSARFRPRTMTDSPALHPLHSAAAIRKQRRSAIAAFRRPQTAETVRTARARPKKQSTNGREASPDQGTSSSPRCFARARHIGNSREHGHFPDATLRWRSISPPGRMADLTDKTRLVRDPVAGLRSLLSRIALVAPNPAIIPLRSIGGDSDSLASRWRDCAGNESSRPGERGTHRLRGSVVMQECFRDITQHTLSVRSFLPHKFFSCRQLPASGTLRHGIYVRQCAVVCYPAASLSR
jgi:hypothetical protein